MKKAAILVRAISTAPQVIGLQVTEFGLGVPNHQLTRHYACYVEEKIGEWAKLENPQLPS